MFLLNKRVMSASSLMIALSACGGDSGGGSGATTNTSPSNEVSTGVFTDSAVAGLRYTTATQSGITDASGTFKYIAGETISNFRD